MTRHEFRLRDYIEHMSEALQRVEEYTSGKTQLEFLSNRLIQDAVMRNFGVLGEAANTLLQSVSGRCYSVSRTALCKNLWASQSVDARLLDSRS